METLETNNQPLISVIIPTYNREVLTRETLDSVLNQTYTHWECIIVDDGSTDNTIAIIKEYLKKDTKLKLFKRDREPKGANTCRNIGIERSTGQYIMFLDSDDLLTQYCLETRLQFSKLHPQCLFWVFLRMNKDVKHNKITTQATFPPKEELLSYFYKLQPPWQTTSVLLRYNFIKEFGGFDEKLPRLQDVDYFVSILTSVNSSEFEMNSSKPDFIRRIGHYDKDTEEMDIKVSYGLWFFLKKNFQKRQNITIDQKNALRLSTKILIFDSLCYRRSQFKRIALIANLAYKGRVLSLYQKNCLLFFSSIVRAGMHKVKGMKFMFRYVII